MSTAERPRVAPQRGADLTGPALPVGRLAAVDGMRAVAALWVVVFHMRAFSGGELWPVVDQVARSGSAGVSMFLVLSGFCLYAPFAGGRWSRFRTSTFLWRRCRRLLPAYYVTLLVTVGLHGLWARRLGLVEMSGAELTFQTAMHASLLHPLLPSTFYALNGAYWSLGLEWQLYLTLPLLMLAVRRFGVARVVISVVLVTVLYRLGLHLAVLHEALPASGVWASVVLPNFFLGRWAEFALGMVAAEMHARGTCGTAARRLGLLAVLAAGASLVTTAHPLKHLVFGVVFFVLLTSALRRGGVVARLLAWPPLVRIGVMSYSLYLVHQPIVEMLAAWIRPRADDDGRLVFLALLASTPLIMAATWLLFMSVERWSIAPPASGGAARAPWWRGAGDIVLPRQAHVPVELPGDEPSPAGTGAQRPGGQS